MRCSNRGIASPLHRHKNLREMNVRFVGLLTGFGLKSKRWMVKRYRCDRVPSRESTWVHCISCIPLMDSLGFLACTSHIQPSNTLIRRCYFTFNFIDREWFDSSLLDAYIGCWGPYWSRWSSWGASTAGNLLVLKEIRFTNREVEQDMFLMGRESR